MIAAVAASEAFGARRARAEGLARGGGSAVLLLRFAGALLGAQERLARALEAGADDGGARLLAAYRAFLSEMRVTAAPEAAEEADARLAEGEAESRARLGALLASRPSGREDFTGRAFLRVVLETRRAAGAPLARAGEGCPACGGAPGMGVLRPGPESEGASRHLLCAHCGHEWPVVRIRCASCGNADPEKLPVFRAERHPGVRLEACESCRRYLKTIDLSLDARPVPEVDEIASVSMDLWAGEEGWTRIEPGIAGT